MTSRIPTRPTIASQLSPRSIGVVAVVLLAVVWVCVLVEPLRWVWGVLFALWAIWGMSIGETVLVTRIRRSEQPAVFWFVSVNWLAIGVLWALYP
ncbi:MAG: hypothetical protein AAF945_20710 [Actinomycetota bacterium]